MTLASALSKMPPHTLVAEAIRSALAQYPHVAKQVTAAVWVDQIRQFGSEADRTTVELAVGLWIEGR